MLEMAINNVEMGSELDRVHILTFCDNSTVSMLTFERAEEGRRMIRKPNFLNEREFHME